MEFVFVVQRHDLFRDCYPQGLVPFGGDFPLGSFESAVTRHGFFVQRSFAETNPAWKQVIPYTVVVRGGDVFLMRRLSKGGEARLSNKLSIGVGGHVNPEDAVPTVGGGGTLSHSPLDNGSRREIEEEIEISGRTRIARVGVINDDSNPVGAVHVGLVQLMVVEGDVRVREQDLLEGRFVPPEELLRLAEQGANFESWSKILVERLPDVLTAHAGLFSAEPGTLAPH
jgi:predicted NUDIX family phosphoesterase